MTSLLPKKEHALILFVKRCAYILRSGKKQQIREKMRKGYAEMAKLNLRLANEAFEVENEANLIAELLVGKK